MSRRNTAYGSPVGLNKLSANPVEARRAPTGLDVGYQIGQIWVNTETLTSYILSGFLSGAASWLTAGAVGGGVTQLTGGADVVLPDAGNITISGAGGISVTGAASTVTITGTGVGTSTLTGNVGVATQAGGNVNVVGAGLITTTGAGNTLTVTDSGVGSVLSMAGTATPAANILTVVGAGTVTTSAAGSTLTITGGGGGGGIDVLRATDLSIASPVGGIVNVVGSSAILSTTGGPGVLTITDNGVGSVTTDSGTATPVANVMEIRGSGTVTTSAAGNIVTLVGTGGGVTRLTGNDSTFATQALGNINVIGFGSVNVTGAGNQLSITGTGGGGGLTWTYVSLSPQQMVANFGYICGAAGLLTFTLPPTAVIGTLVEVVGNVSSGWRVLQNAGQTIVMGLNTTTITTGSLASTDNADCISLICITPDTGWAVKSSMGNITVV